MTTTLYYRAQGQGDALVLLHSGAMTGAEWEPQLALFGDYFYTLAPDQPGHGHSPLAEERLSIGGCARAVLRWLDELAIDRAHLVGSSFGGAVALWLAVHHPERVHKLVLYRVGYRKDAASYAGTRQLADPDYWRSVGLTHWLSQAHTPQGGPDAWQRVITRVLEALDPVSSDHHHDRAALARLPQPTLIIAGDRDPLVPVHHAIEMFQTIPQAGLWLLPYATHVTATNTWRGASFALEVTRFLQGRGIVRAAE